MDRDIQRLGLFTAFLVAVQCLADPPTEQSLRAADAVQMPIIVTADVKAQNTFMHPNYIINGPANRVMRKADVVKMLGEGKMASEKFERVIEGIAMTGNIGVVMGREVVQPGPNSELGKLHGTQPLRRRFTNIFIFENDKWYFLARQASIIQ